MNEMKDKGNFFRNPIGVIGVFLVLTEGIASAVIMYSNLNEFQNNILVIFVACFPCIVLWVFYLLVTEHHEKLYSPLDYRDEKNFVDTYNSNTQKNETVSTSKEEGTSSQGYDENVEIMKDALIDIVQLQKKIVPTMENSIISEDDREDYMSNMDYFLKRAFGEREEHILKVEISPMYKCSKLVEELVKNNYVADIYRFGSDKKFVRNVEHEAIWLGCHVPLEMAINVIKIAKKYYPHLKYIQMNDYEQFSPEYVKYEIYVGGATSTAKERKLRELTEEDYEKLYSFTNLDDLHEYIYSFDPACA